MGLQLPQAPPVVPAPPNRVLLQNLVPGNFYTVIHRNGPNQPMQETFTGRFLQAGTTLPNNDATARFDSLVIPNQPGIPPHLWRTVMDDDWYYVPLEAPPAAPPAHPSIASRRGGKRKRVLRKRTSKRTMKKSNRKNCRK